MNVVTSVTDRVAQNFGYERHLEHDERYDMAMEWIDVVKQLQESWEPDAVIADPYRGVYADHTKVTPIEFVGKYFKCRGPLNTIPGPQRTTPVCSPVAHPPAARWPQLTTTPRSRSSATPRPHESTARTCGLGWQPWGAIPTT